MTPKLKALLEFLKNQNRTQEFVQDYDPDFEMFIGE